MAEKTSLTAALTEPQQPAERPTPQSRTAQTRPDREGKTNITGYFDMPVKWELADIANERSRRLGRKVTQQDLLEEMLNDFFKKEGRPELATLRKRNGT